MTNPTPSAEEPTGEQALKWLVTLCENTGKGSLWNVDARAVLRAIRHAEQAKEQAAYERAANLAEFKWKSRLIAEAIRALANESGEPGEAAWHALR